MDKLAEFHAAEAAYRAGAQEVDRLRVARDQALRALYEDNRTMRDLVEETGWSLGRVQQILKRAGAARPRGGRRRSERT